MRYLIVLLCLISTSAAAQSGSCRIWDGQGTFAGVGASGLAVNAQGSTLSNIQTSADSIDTATGLIEGYLSGALSSSRFNVNPISGQIGVAGGSGVVGATTQRVTLATDVALPTGTNSIGQVTCNAGTNLNTSSLATEATLSTLNGKITACNTGAVTVSAALPAGNNNIGDVDAIQSGTWTVQPGNTANTTPWLVTNSPATSGGLTTYHLVSAASTNATNIKASAGQLYCYSIFNTNAAARKVAFHNTSGTPTAGASVFFSLMIPASSGANVCTDTGIPFSSGIGITTVTGAADSDTAAVGANDLIINLFYK